MTGILVDINTINYGTAKDKVLHLAVFQVESFERSIVISSAKAEVMKDQIEQEFNMIIKDIIVYSKSGEDYVPRPGITLSLGSKVK